jgi:hypothetical protein
MKQYQILFFCLMLSGLSFAQVCATREWSVHQARSAKIDTTRIAGIANNFNFWRTGQIITVALLNGTKEQEAAILAIAKEWEAHGNIKFEAADAARAMVRISLGKADANYSLVGTDILQVKPSECTMQLDAALFGKKKDQFRKVVLHQFGHVLGMVHEFNPVDGGFQWDKPFIARTYNRAGWSATDIQQNIYGLYTHRITNGWRFDRSSIMHLGIALRHMNGGVPILNNYDISDGDKDWVSSRYPFGHPPGNKKPPFVHTR